MTTPTAPTAPTDLTATPAANGLSVTLSWTDNAINEDNYAIERCTGSNCAGFTVLSSTVAANSTGYTDSAVTAGTTYRYRIEAINGVGVSTYASTLDVQTPISSRYTDDWNCLAVGFEWHNRNSDVDRCSYRDGVLRGALLRH